MAANRPKIPTVPCLRVTQLDALDLDNYLVELLIRQQFDKCIRQFFPKYIEKLKPELQTTLYAMLMYYTVGRLHQTVGQKLFGVMLANSSGLGVAPMRKIQGLIVLETFFYWWGVRYGDCYPSFISSRPKLAKSVDVLISIVKVLEICNFLIFLRRGEFGRVLLRLLGLRVAFDHPDPSPSSISYTILSRDLLWRGFAEVSMYFLTMLDIPRWKKYFLRRYRSLNELKPDLKNCALCEDWPTMAHESDCGHVFCYYCVSTTHATGSNCPICGVKVESFKVTVVKSES